MLSQDALTGFDMNFAHLDGHLVNVKRDKITWPGARIRKKGEGMPNYDDNNLFGKYTTSNFSVIHHRLSTSFFKAKIILPALFLIQIF